MEKFKKEIKIILEGEYLKEEPSLKEIIENLKIEAKHWWENNPSWPYGEPCDQVKKYKVNKINIKTLKDA